MDTIDINARVAPLIRDVRIKKSVNLDEDILPFESILELVDTTQPIFRDNGIMQRITISADLRQYLNDEGSRNKSNYMIGHNNLKISDWWPKQIYVLRNGPMVQKFLAF